MNDQELRRRVVRDVRVETPDAVWVEIIELYPDKYADALEGGGNDYERFVEEVRSHARTARAWGTLPSPMRRADTQPLTLPADADEMARMQALSEGLATLAAANPEVRRFREEAWGEGLLAPEEADELLCSRAAAWFPGPTFRGTASP